MSRVLILKAMPLETMGHFRNWERRTEESYRQVLCAQLRHSAHDCSNSVGPLNKPARSLEALRDHFDVSQMAVPCGKPSFKYCGSMTEMDFDMTRLAKLISLT